MKRPPALTDIEMTILEHLQQDARLASADLASRLNSSTTSVWRRIKKLEEAGLVRGYHAQIDARELGFGIESFLTVSVHSHDERSIQLFEAAVATIDDIVSCHLVSGTGDYLLRVVSKDMESYAEFITHVAATLPGVRETHSAFVLRTIKPFAGLPIRKACRD
ncbi:MAG TPA: Lrp/AsnC family transcriptional regulator [Albitalea sp.]|nr:Lrp/AsnC family transcriptional regulator [Albitalea sp.]